MLFVLPVHRHSLLPGIAALPPAFAGAFVLSGAHTWLVPLSIGYRFGKSQVNVKSTNRSIQNDDMESTSRGASNSGGQAM